LNHISSFLKECDITLKNYEKFSLLKINVGGDGWSKTSFTSSTTDGGAIYALSMTARKIATKSPIAIRMAKRSLNTIEYME
jgi:hypothetical protein